MASEDERRERAIRTINDERDFTWVAQWRHAFHTKPVTDDEVRREMDDDG